MLRGDENRIFCIMKYIIKEVNRLVGQAIHGYHLLDHGDRILAAVSGGVDSMLALWMLRQWRKKAPIGFEVLAVYLDMGFGGNATEELSAAFSGMGVQYHVEETGYGAYAHGPENRGKSPCFICSMLRRKRIFELAHHFGCNKVAFGHNQDDLIETFFMNMIYSGELSTMVPRQEMFKGLLTIIRPLALVNKERIERVAEELGMEPVPNPCPSAGRTKRAEVKEILQGIYASSPKARGNIMHALTNIRPEYLPLRPPPA